MLPGLDGCPAAWLSPRLAFQNSPLGATGDGAGAAAEVEAEAAWYCGIGGGAGGTSHCS